MESVHIYNTTGVSLGEDLNDRQWYSVGFGRILQADMTAKEEVKRGNTVVTLKIQHYR